jgi:adenine-specific DNA-methyltransferase
MELNYKNKRSEIEILETTVPAQLEVARTVGIQPVNKLIKGENLEVMKSLLVNYDLQGKVDLVYIDPPFSTNNVFRHNGERTSTISSSKEDDIAYTDTLQGEEFLEFIRERLILIRELLANHGSIYLHIDYKIGHYVKIIMDEVFGKSNFRNDIARIKCNPKNFARKGYGNVKDLILFYSKTDNFTWNEPYSEMTGEDIERLFSKIDQKGQLYTTTPLHAPGETSEGNTGKPWRGMLPPKGRHWRYDPSVLDELDNKGLIEWSKNGNPRKKIYAEEAALKGKRMQDIWEFKDAQYPSYPTEKNIDLLKTIIKTSSNPGQMVLDCFCGSGTTLVASHELGRHWLGIDNSQTAIEVAIDKLTSDAKLINLGADYEYLQQEHSHAGIQSTRD